MKRGVIIFFVILLALGYWYISKSESAEPAPPQKTNSPPTAQQPTQEQKTPQGASLPVSGEEVKRLAMILALNDLQDGSVIEFHISGSHSESYSVSVNKGAISIKSGETAPKDMVIWVSRKAFYEILNSPNPTETIKSKVGNGEMSFTREASMITLYRKGYKKLVDTLGLL